MSQLARGEGRGATLWEGDFPSSGVYRLEANLWPEEIATETAARGWRFFYLYGATIFDKHTFLDACQAAFDLPGYFGHNWDAFEETIADLSWAPAAGYVLLYDRVANFAVNRPAEWAIALDILRSAANQWARRGVPCYVLLRETGGMTPGVPLLRT
jgi:hypothetical protein